MEKKPVIIVKRVVSLVLYDESWTGGRRYDSFNFTSSHFFLEGKSRVGVGQGDFVCSVMGNEIARYFGHMFIAGPSASHQKDGQNDNEVFHK